MPDKKKHVVVLGNGMASFRFCEKLLEYDAHHQYRVTILGEEAVPAYDRIALSSTFSGTTIKELVFSEPRWYVYHKMDLQLGTRATSINTAKKSVTTSEKNEIQYDHLVIATGARPHVPNMLGTDLKGIHVYRSAKDAAAILVDANNVKHAVVIGGGLLGLEAAEACNGLGLKTTIVEREPWLMTCQLDEAAGNLLRSKIELLGIQVLIKTHVAAFDGKQSVHSIRLKNGKTISADLVVLATGIDPNDELAESAGLEVGAFGGIAIDATTRTSIPDIYALGECASFSNQTFGLIAPCYAMAEAAAAHLGGINKTFTPTVPASQLKLLDLQVASIGEISIEHGSNVVNQNLEAGVYKKLYISADNKNLLGAILVGETSEFSRLQKIIEEKIELPATPQELLSPIGTLLEPDLDIEDDDMICFCNYVTKADICRAIDREKLQSTKDVMDITFAASLCGSCYETVDRVTKHHLAHQEE